MNPHTPRYGLLAHKYHQVKYPLRVLESAKGFYIGTTCQSGVPFSRESVEYFPTMDDGFAALLSGEWQQRLHA